MRLLSRVSAPRKQAAVDVAGKVGFLILCLSGQILEGLARGQPGQALRV